VRLIFIVTHGRCTIIASVCPRNMIAFAFFLAASFARLCGGTNRSYVGRCNVGDVTQCLDGTSCAGKECCQDGSVCPSAPSTWDMCPHPKSQDCTEGNWFDGIKGLKVFSPGDDVTGYAQGLYNGHMEEDQFSTERYVMLLRRGDYSGQQLSAIPVGYYTSVIGVGDSPEDVTIDSFYSLDNPKVGNACDNFWRHAAGLQTSNSDIMWATSQAAPLRRVHIKGNLQLSENGAPHWSSGGHIAESIVDGTLDMGTQQQFLVRNVNLGSGVTGSNKNYVFVGSSGAPASSADGTITNIASTPRAGGAPYLSEDAGQWSIKVPLPRKNVVGYSPAAVSTISFSDVFVAREGDTAAQINSAIATKKALLLTPAIYGLESAITIQKSNFVVLGLGFATLVAYRGNSAIEVAASADSVHISSVLLEAGTAASATSTSPLLSWLGSNGFGTDIFTRVGAFSYATTFKPSCLKTRADIHIEIVGSGTTLDNIWVWHADHDDCGGASDQSYSAHGLVVRGASTIVYGLKAEHTFDNIVQWFGEAGQTYLLQSELPYHVASYPSTGAYMVDQQVKEHMGVGIGVYQIGTYTVDTGVRVPASASMRNVFVWCITGPEQRFKSVICTSRDGLSSCYYGDRCDSNSCYQYQVGRRSSDQYLLSV